jgi:hypothetical protein
MLDAGLVGLGAQSAAMSVMNTAVSAVADSLSPFTILLL